MTDTPYLRPLEAPCTPTGGSRAGGVWFHDHVRVLISTTAGAGHFGPMLPLARGCVMAGHDVAVAAPASFADHVARAGLPHLAFPDVPADQLAGVFNRLPGLPPREANRLVVSEVFGRLDARAALPTLLDIVADQRPDVILRDPCEFGSLMAAKRSGTPQVQVAIGVQSFLLAVSGWVDEPLQELAQRAGVTTAGAGLMLETPTFTSLPPVFDDVRGGTGPPGVNGPVWRFRVEDAAAGPALPAEWGDPSAPLVYVSFGSVAGTQARFGPVYARALHVLADLPIRVLITTGPGFDPTALAPLPPNTFATTWWPQEAAMADTALVIGHGGFGTTTTALRAGIPQLVVPLFSADQFINAERIQAVGAGRQLAGGPDRFDDIPDLVTELLGDQQVARICGDIAADFAALPDVATAVGVLEELAGHRRPRLH